MLGMGEVIEVGDEFYIASMPGPEWSPVKHSIGQTPTGWPTISFRRPLAAREWREMGPEEIIEKGDEKRYFHEPAPAWVDVGAMIGDTPARFRGYCEFRTRRPSPPAAVPNERVTQAPRDGFDHTPKPAPLTEERIAALTVGTPPGRGLIHEDIRRVCPTCGTDVPAYLARCKCGAIDRPVFRFMGGGR